MQNDYIAPVDHGMLSTAGNVTGGALLGALKTVGKVAFWCVAIGAGIGLLSGAGLLTLPATGSFLASLVPSGLGSAVSGALWGALAGGIGAAMLTPLAGLVGAGKGASNAAERVAMERGAAKVMEMELAANVGRINSAQQNYGFATQGTHMNQANPSLMAGTASHQGTVADRQLARGA